MQEEIQQLREKVQELEMWKKSLEKSSSIPLAVDQAFRARFGQPNKSGKVNSSENVTAITSIVFATEAITTASVLGAPDDWLEVNIQGNKFFLPSFTS